MRFHSVELAVSHTRIQFARAIDNTPPHEPHFGPVVITMRDHEVMNASRVLSTKSSKIVSVETHVFAQPTRREHKWTGLTESIGRYVLVRMTDDVGNVGWGEAPALKDWGGEFGRYFGESTAIVELVIERYLAPAVKGLDPANIVELHARMDTVIKGYPYAKAAVEFAAYDLAGKRLGVPVHMLLGGCARKQVPVTHS